jgi:hypothetical protein
MPHTYGDVHEDDVRMVCAGLLDPGPAIRGLQHGVAGKLQQGSVHLAVVRVVIHDEDGCTAHDSSLYGLCGLVAISETLAQESPSTALCYAMHCVGTAVIAAKATDHQKQAYLESSPERRTRHALRPPCTEAPPGQRMPPDVSTRAPGPTGWDMLRRLRRSQVDPLAEWMDARAVFGDVVRYRAGRLPIHLVSHPDDVQRVLQGNWRNYRKGMFNQPLVPLLGHGLLTNEGETWLSQRRLLQPAFQREHLADLASIMVEEAKE